MKLYIIRHGETAWNVEGRLQGQTDTELNENGVRLAKVTAEGLKNIPFDLGISSDFGVLNSPFSFAKYIILIDWLYTNCWQG